MSKRRTKNSVERQERYVKLMHVMTQSPAWRDLTCYARAGYIEIARRYGGPNSNNSSIPFSVREMAENLGVSSTTAMRVFKELQAHGFIVEMRRGRYGKKRRLATEWRLTEFRCDATQAPPTKDFLNWQGEARSKLSTMDFVDRGRAKASAANAA